MYITLVNKYYQKSKERHWKAAREIYQNFSEEEKDKSWKQIWDRYQNLPEEQKQNVLEYMKKYFWLL